MNKNKAVIFDFDDTIIKMPTKIKLFNKTKGDYVSLSTSSFAKYKNLVGKEGFFKHCSFDIKSFEEFSSHENKSFFVEDIVKLIRSSNHDWKAMYFEYFLEMLSTEETSENVYVLSARSHSPAEFLDGLRILQTFLEKKHKIKIFLPRKEHLHFVGSQKNISLAKSSVIESIVRKESGEQTTYIEFADDDHDNVLKAKDLFESLKDSFDSITFYVSHVFEKSVHKFKIK